MGATRENYTGFWGTKDETYYVDSHSRVWIIQSPDLVGVCDRLETACVPEDAESLPVEILDDGHWSAAAIIERESEK